MRKEFEEKEKSTSEENIRTSVEDMTDEEFQKFLEEQYTKEAEERQKELFADQDFEDLRMTDKEIDASYAKFVERLKAEGLYEEDTEESDTENPENLSAEAVKGRSTESSSKSGEKIYPISGRRTRKLAKVAGIGIVCALCVFAASMTSEANRNYFINGFRILSGSDTRMVVDNDGGNEKANADEYQAMADIEEKLGVKVPEFYYRPYGMEFDTCEINDISKIAWIEYKYKTAIITFCINEQNKDTSSYVQSVSGENETTVLATTENLEVKIEKIEEDGDNQPSYSAKWKRDNIVYYLYGRIEEEELIKIIENMDF